MTIQHPRAAVGVFDKAYELILLVVFTVLPVAGLMAGPSYAPLLFGLAGVSLILRRVERIDWPLAALALLFLALCAAGLGGSIAPAVSQARLYQLAGIFIGCLLLLGIDMSSALGNRLAVRLFWSILAGVTLLCLDTALGYPMQRWLTHGALNAATKYNRGLIALMLIGWPVLAALPRKQALFLALAMALAVSFGLSSTATLAFATGGMIWVLAYGWPRTVACLLGFGMTLLAFALPFLLRLLSQERHALTWLKPSGQHRLEIWDYMSARILDHPLTGWGLGAAKAVPIRPEELASYLYVSADGIYPHNQWIELWLETGLPGVLLALALLQLLLWRIRTQPFALAAVASALVVSLLDFEITTDSWWAALAVVGVLFRLRGDGKVDNMVKIPYF